MKTTDDIIKEFRKLGLDDVNLPIKSIRIEQFIKEALEQVREEAEDSIITNVNKCLYDKVFSYDRKTGQFGYKLKANKSKLPCGCPSPDKFAICINQEHLKPEEKKA